MFAESIVESGSERWRPAWTRRSDDDGMLVLSERRVLRVDIDVDEGMEKGMSGVVILVSGGGRGG